MDLNIDHDEELKDYLNRELGIESNSLSGIETLSGGVSNRTRKINFSNGESWVIKQALSTLRVKEAWESNPDRILREAAALVWLNMSTQVSTPQLIHQDEKHFIIIMNAIQPPFSNSKSWLLEGHMDQNYFIRCGDMLGEIHAQSKDPSCFPTMLMDQSYFESLRLDPFYEASARSIPETANFFNNLVLKSMQNPWCLVHGDFSPKNILMKEDYLILIDHEVIHYGEGSFDLGFFMSHILSKANHIPENRNELIECLTLFLQQYANHIPLNPDYEALIIDQCLGCLLARIVGKSPLPYLSLKEKAIQKSIALQIMKNPPIGMSNFLNQYKQLLYAYN